MQKRINTNPSQTPPKDRKGGNSSKLILGDQHYPNNQNQARYHKKRKLQANTLTHRHTKILNKILRNPKQYYIESIIHHDQV